MIDYFVFAAWLKTIGSPAARFCAVGDALRERRITYGEAMALLDIHHDE